MKKYLINRKVSEIECFQCKQKCLKPITEINRNIKLNRKLFCSRKCSIVYGNINFSNRLRYDISKHSDNRKSNKFSIYLKNVKNRHKDFSLELTDLENQWNLQKGICPYSGISMILKTNKKSKAILNQASLDRIDSSKGYIKNNIEFVCLGINYLKSTFTKLEVLEFLNNFNLDFSKDRTISSE